MACVCGFAETRVKVVRRAAVAAVLRREWRALMCVGVCGAALMLCGTCGIDDVALRAGEACCSMWLACPGLNCASVRTRGVCAPAVWRLCDDLKRCIAPRAYVRA